MTLIFLDKPFEKLLMPRDLLRRYQEVEDFCCEQPALVYLTDNQRLKASQRQGDPLKRSTYIRNRLRENFNTEARNRQETRGARAIDIPYGRSIYHGLSNDQYTPENPRVLLVITGGTGFCWENSLNPSLPKEKVLNRIPFLQERYDLRVFDFFDSVGRIDSSQMDPGDQALVAKIVEDAIKDHQPDGVVVAHGTDQMINTAHALSLTTRWPVPVVLTGAMKAGEIEDSDIVDNLRTSLFFSVAPIKPATYVCFDGKLYEGTRVVHHHTDPKQAFTSMLSDKTGACGEFYSVDEMGGRLEFSPLNSERRASEKRGFLDVEGVTNLGFCPRVLDRRLGITDRHQSWYSVNVEFEKAVERVRKSEVSLKPDYSRPPEVRTLSSRPKVRGITLYNESDDLRKQLSNIYGENVGVLIRSFSGNMRPEDIEAISSLTAQGTPVVIGTKLLFGVAETSRYAVAEGLRNNELLIYPEGMTEDMTVAKLSIAMGMLNEAIDSSGRRWLREPDRYLPLVKRIMGIDVAGETGWSYRMEESLYDEVQRIVNENAVEPEGEATS